ncbi:hypothetical protein [Salibacterium aidingense]|uniref:hypothetical protein n=1 Tax=Salibacterium aidingense TaxID=384933 RepID=UPI003BC8ECAD
MGIPVHNKKRQIVYLKERLRLLQGVLEQMEAENDFEKPEIERIEELLKDTVIKVKQFKQDWN